MTGARVKGRATVAAVAAASAGCAEKEGRRKAGSSGKEAGKRGFYGCSKTGGTRNAGKWRSVKGPGKAQEEEEQGGP